MNTKLTFSTTLVFGLLAITLGGCGKQDPQTESNSSETTNVSLNATQEQGCCGKCAQEQEAGKAEGCCGKCKTEAAAGEQSEGKTCDEGCDACGEGNEAACQCEGEGVAAKAEAATTERKVKSLAEDRDVFHYLLSNHEKIKREVEVIENGVKTKTISDDPAVIAKIQDHVESMKGRVEDGRMLRRWDEMFQAVFANATKIKMEIERTEDGIIVIETSDDPFTVKLIQAHAKVVSGFVDRGFDEARENHPVPEK